MKGGEASFQWGNNEKEVDCAERIYKIILSIEYLRRKLLYNERCILAVRNIGMMIKTDNLPYPILLEED